MRWMDGYCWKDQLNKEKYRFASFITFGAKRSVLIIVGITIKANALSTMFKTKSSFIIAEIIIVKI